MVNAGKGPLRALLFYDYGWAENNLLAGQTDPLKAIIASTGVGLRGSIEKTLALRFDLAWVLRGAASETRGDTRGHVFLYYGF
jgi:hemolysin activation/secretion protein